MSKNIGKINMCNNIIGHLPASYKIALSYEEQILLLGNKIDEIIDFANNTLSQQIQNYIDNRFNNILMDTMYEEDTETLVLYLRNEN